MDIDTHGRVYALELLTTQLISEYLRTVPDPTAQTKWARGHLDGRRRAWPSKRFSPRIAPAPAARTTSQMLDPTRPTQVGRALAQLGIEHIAAYPPQGRGRSERLFGTLQDRLPKELKLAGITTLEAANRFIAEVYVAEHNARFAGQPAERGSAFDADPAGAWREALCVQEDRLVGNDNTLRYHRLVLQLPQSPQRPHFVKAKVRVHHYPDGTLAVFHGPRRLARYDANGASLDQDKLVLLNAAWRPAPRGHVDDSLRGPAALPPCRRATRRHARLRPHDHRADLSQPILIRIGEKKAVNSCATNAEQLN